MSQGSKDISIVIYERDGACHVVPPHCIASPGDTVTFKNLTRADIFVFLPGPLGANAVIRIGCKDYDYKSNPLPVQGGFRGAHRYMVYCESPEGSARAASDPDIIFDG